MNKVFQATISTASLFLIFLFSILVSSCSIEKRHYLPGYSIQTISLPPLINSIAKDPEINQSIQVPQNKIITQKIEELNVNSDVSNSLFASIGKQIQGQPVKFLILFGHNKLEKELARPSSVSTQNFVRKHRKSSTALKSPAPGSSTGYAFILSLLLIGLPIFHIVRAFSQSPTEGFRALGKVLLILGLIYVLFLGLTVVLFGVSLARLGLIIFLPGLILLLLSLTSFIISSEF